MPKARVSGMEMFYETTGNGEPLLLIAGFACDHIVWSMIDSALASRYRVTVFDNRGVGQSTPPDGPYGIHHMAEDAAGLLKALGVSSAHVAGHSMGGQIGIALALAYPEMVRSLMLIASTAKSDEHGKAIIEVWGELPGLVDPETSARLIFPWIYTNAFYEKPDAIAQLMKMVLNNPFPPTAEAIHFQSRAISEFDAQDRLDGIRCPTLVLAGEKDILLPPSCSERLARGISGADLCVLEKTGHGLLIESPQVVSAAMIDFLARLP